VVRDRSSDPVCALDCAHPIRVVDNSIEQRTQAVDIVVAPRRVSTFTSRFNTAIVFDDLCDRDR